ncbi:hypothetical protein H257_17236 [Aphanomyces astaci]|uniref:Uncharacterized protein n=1 Tax=Aphanomyces astaci TaxID=112090 RepID=W4FFH5_APHAT|nr:hypothetical protein H257_17236 [Aphanomyces astaci]ETV66267.1 hypothetical protein H257_17236 [Aphanomyces astaci]|eukprot:XP_009844254.1 hypothetical protein H257_17236 [Aphanomyces astaci]
MENANATPGVPRDNSIVVLYRETDWIGRPTDLKDTEEYEHSIQRSRRNRIIMIATAALVIVGVAIGVIAGTTGTDEASVSSGESAATVPTPSRPSTPTAAADAVVPPSPLVNNLPAPVVNATWNATTSAEVLVGSNGVEIVNATLDASTVTPEPTTTTTTTPEGRGTTPETTTTTPAPTTTTPAPTTTTPAPTTTTPAPTTTTATPPPPPTTTRAPPAPAPLSPGQIRYVNNCDKTYKLWKSHRELATLKPGDSYDTQGTADVSAAYYLSDDGSGNASLFENHFEGGNFWYDLSIIPVGCGSSWDSCNGKPKSFNLPVSVRVSDPRENCKHLTCASPSCTDAYFVPNDKQTWVCPGSVSMTVAFC